MRIRDPGWENSDPGSGMKKILIRDKHPGSATVQPVQEISYFPSIFQIPYFVTVVMNRTKYENKTYNATLMMMKQI
jgi:hypothetical protein